MGGRGLCGGGSGGVSIHKYPLSRVIEQAYGIKGFQLVGRPSWLSTERFDIEAKAASRAGYDECKVMLQHLLEDRFKLQTHREVRQLPVYRLTVARNGPKLRKLQPDAQQGVKTFNTMAGELSVYATSMPQLVRMLSMTGELDNQVLDSTGLDGIYEFTLKWTPAAMAGPDSPEGPSLFTALQEQLGLRLEAGRGDVEVLVIDHVEKVPTEN